MRIQLRSGSAPAVLDADTFTSFDVVTDAGAPDALHPTLAELEFEGAEHVWILAEAIPRWAGRSGDGDWQRAFEGMIAYARSRGWVRTDPLRIRAHIAR